MAQLDLFARGDERSGPTGSTGHASASQRLHAACGSPGADAGPVACCVCCLCGGETERGASFGRWVGANFTGHNLLVGSSGIVCEACMFICSRTSPVPGRPPKPGKKFGGNFRNYTHMGEGGSYVNASKGEKDLIRSFLCRPKIGEWWCAVGESGQKHVIPYTPVNFGGGVAGVVRFEESDVRIPGDAREQIERMCRLLTDGVSKAEAQAGSYHPQTWRRVGVARLRAEEARLREIRGGRWFDLLVWVSQRDEEKK